MLDIEEHRKLYVLSGGTKVVNHNPPPKNTAGLKCKIFSLWCGFLFYFVIYIVA